jgi:WD40 repeat protein
VIFELVADYMAATEAIPKDHSVRGRLLLIEEAIARHLHFIDRHPTTLFQSLWNQCWWHDCPAADQHFNDARGRKGRMVFLNGKLSFEAAEKGNRPLKLPWTTKGPKLHELFESWRGEKEAAIPGGFWLRAIRPHPMPLGRGLNRVLVGHDSRVNCVAWSSGGRFLASASHDRTVRVWGRTTDSRVRVLEHAAEVCCVAFSPSGRSLVSSSFDKTIRTWDLRSGELLTQMPTEDVIDFLFYSAEGQSIIGVSRDAIDVWKSASGNRMEARKLDSATCVAMTQDGNHMAIGLCDGGIEVLDVRSWSLALALEGNVMCDCLAYTLCGSRVVGVSRDKTIRIWDAQSGQIVNVQHPAVTEAEEALVTCIAISADGSLLALGFSNNDLQIRHLSSGMRLWSRDHSLPVTSIAFSADGDHIMCASGNNISVWDTPSLPEIGTLGRQQIEEGVERHKMAVAIKNLVSDTYSRIQNAQDMAQLADHGGNAIGFISFSHDGTHLATSSRLAHGAGVALKVWDSRTGALVAKLDKLIPAFERGQVVPNTVSRLEFSSDNAQVVCHLEGSLEQGSERHNEAASFTWNYQSLEGQAIVSVRVAERFEEAESVRHLCLGSETVFMNMEDAPIAWWPTALRHIVRHARSSTLGAVDGSYLSIVSLEG